MKRKELNKKKHIKIQRTQPSLQAFAYNESCTRHKYKDQEKNLE